MKTRFNRLIGLRITLGMVAFSLVATAAQAQPGPGQRRTRPTEQSAGFKENTKMYGPFKEVVRAPAKSVVRIRSDGHDAALGTIVAADGWVLTKYSELDQGKAIEVKMKDGRTLPAKVVGMDAKLDLAMLKIEATNLTPVTWGDTKGAVVGNLLAAPGTSDDPIAIGVVSVAARSVRARDLPPSAPPQNAGFLGVGLDESEGGAKILNVLPDSAAQKAGLRVNDIVTLIADTPIIDTETMINTIQHHKPGDVVSIKIKRGEKELEIKAILDKRAADPGRDRRDYQNHLGSELSNRRGGFPAILQSDMVIKPTDCGGPIVDLEGKAIGISIARAGRTESYVLPVENIKAVIDELKGGKMTKVEEKK